MTMDLPATTMAAGHGPGETGPRPVTGRRMPWFVVGTLTALMAAGYSVYGLARYRTFHYNAYDLVIFDQAVRSYAHFRPGISIIKGLHNGFGPHFSVLGDHWSPILAVLAPLYWLDSSPQTLLVAQSVLFALAIPPLWAFTRRAFGGGPQANAVACLVSVAYGLSWPIAEAGRVGFHEVAFAPVLTAVALERLQAGRLRTDSSPWLRCCWSRRTWASSWPGSAPPWPYRAQAWFPGSAAPPAAGARRGCPRGRARWPGRPRRGRCPGGGSRTPAAGWRRPSAWRCARSR